MKRRELLFVVSGAAAALLSGCAGSSSTASSSPNAPSPAGPALIATPTNSDTPPPTLSGYMDSSYTVQGR